MKKRTGILLLFFVCLSLCFSLAGCGSKSYPQIDGSIGKKDVTLVMDVRDYGKIKLVLYGKIAPKAVENFSTHAKNGYYDGLTFHRVINEFMIQGGAPNDSSGGYSIWGGKFDDELSDQLYHFRGALCYANAGPNTNGSQFYIVQCQSADYSDEAFDNYEEIARQVIDYERQNNTRLSGYPRCTSYPEEVRAHYRKVGGYPGLDQGYTVFGQVIEGMEVVDAIAATEVGDADRPLQDVIINSITVEE